MWAEKGRLPSDSAVGSVAAIGEGETGLLDVRDIAHYFHEFCKSYILGKVDEKDFPKNSGKSGACDNYKFFLLKNPDK